MEEDRLVTHQGIVIECTAPFSFSVNLETGEQVSCGLIRSYFGRMSFEQAAKRIKRNGPRVGDKVTVRLSTDSGQITGTILRPDQL
jgi:hypothetical protein